MKKTSLAIFSGSLGLVTGVYFSDELRSFYFQNFPSDRDLGSAVSSRVLTPEKFIADVASSNSSNFFSSPFPRQKPVRDEANTQDVVAACVYEPLNGNVFTNELPQSELTHDVKIINGTGSNSIVKIRQAEEGVSILTGYVRKNSDYNFQFIPDGAYQIQFAFGDKLDSGCQNFLSIKGAMEFPNQIKFETIGTDEGYSLQAVELTLHDVWNGNVSPKSITLDDFLKP